MMKSDFARIGKTGQRRGAGRIGGARQRNVPFSGKQAGGRIKTDPSGAGKIDLGPRMQIGKVALGTGGTVEALYIGGELHEVTGNKPRRQSEMPQDLHQQPCAVATRSDCFVQRLLTALDAWIETDLIGDVALHRLIEPHQKIDRSAFLPIEAFQPASKL